MNNSCLSHRMFNDVDEFVVDGSIAQAVEVFFSAGGVVAMDGVGNFIEV